LNNLSQNLTRGAHHITDTLLTHRKQCDRTELYPKFHRFATADQPQIFVLENDETFFGMNLVLTDIFRYLDSKANKTQENRSPGDCIRAVYVMTRPTHRILLQHFLSGTRTNRAQSNQPNDPNIAWATECLIDFNNPAFQVPRPDLVRDEDIENVDPNEQERIDRNADSRTPEWFLDCWRTYGKGKYKEAVNKWDGVTGLGSGDHSLFGNFCGTKQWLAWVYQIDQEADHHLWCNATGKPAPGIGREVGFDDDDDNNANEDSTSSNKRSSIKIKFNKKQEERRELQHQLELHKETTKAVRDTVGKLSTLIEKKTNKDDDYIHQLCSLDARKRTIDGSDLLSPESKRAATKWLKQEAANVGVKLKQAMKSPS